MGLEDVEEVKEEVSVFYGVKEEEEYEEREHELKDTDEVNRGGENDLSRGDGDGNGGEENRRYERDKEDKGTVERREGGEQEVEEEETDERSVSGKNDEDIILL